MHAQLNIPDLLLALMERAPAGFAIGLHVRYQTPFLMFQTYPVEWLTEYSHQRLVLQDPTITWAAGYRGVISWEELRHQDPAGVFEKARAHGIVHGFAVTLERGGSHSLASFARGNRPFTPRGGGDQPRAHARAA